jgi:hypothetical protein
MAYGAVMTNTGFPAVPAPEFADPLPGYGYVGERCIAASYRIPDGLKRRTNGVVRFAGDTGQIPGIESQTDLIRVAAHCYVSELERQFNDGQPFPDPGANNHRGRGADHPGQWVKIGVRLPLSLHQRIMGAARFVDDTGSVPGVTSANRLIAAALDAKLTELERDHNHGKPFHDPRRHLPKGRLPAR